jgi:hypothetical protein
MARECKLRIQIASGAVQEAAATWGFHLVETDDTILAPIREYETQRYPESSAEEIWPYTVQEPFDYKCTLLCFGALSTLNSSLKTFYDSLFTITAGVDLRQAKPITLYNDYKAMKVTGYAKTVEGKDYYPELKEYEKGAYLFDFVLHISDPKTLIAL